MLLSNIVSELFAAVKEKLIQYACNNKILFMSLSCIDNIYR